MKEKLMALFKTNDDKDEGLPLLHSQITYTKKIKIAGVVACSVLSLSTLSMIVYFTTLSRTSEKNNDSPLDLEKLPDLSFEFDVPQQGTGNIVIYNTGEGPAVITDIQFVTNAVITKNPEGNLAPSGSTIETMGQQKNLITYKLTEPSNGIVIEANSHKNLQYTYELAKGPINVGVLPQDIVVRTPQSTLQVPFADQCVNAACNDPFKGHIVGGKYRPIDMYESHFNVSQIKPQINRIYYGPIGFDAYGNLQIDTSSASFQMPGFQILEQQYPWIKVGLSFGPSDTFSQLARNTTAQNQFIKNTLNLFELYGFSGMNIQWDSIKQQEGTLLVGMLKNFRQLLNNSGKNYELSFEPPSNPNTLGHRAGDFASAINYLLVNVCGLNWPNPVKSGYQSPFSVPMNDPNPQNSTMAILALYSKYQYPLQNIVMCLPADFVGYSVASMDNEGMWQTVTGTTVGQYQPGRFNFDCAINKNCYDGSQLPLDCKYLDNGPYSDFSHTPMFSCPSTKAIFTGESTVSVQFKTNYVVEQNLKGVYLNSLSGDTRKDSGLSLLNTIDETIIGKNASANRVQNGLTTDITNVQQWNAFLNNFQETVVSSSLGGLAYTFVFKLIEKATDAVLDKLIAENKGAIANDQTLYYSLKAMVYLATFYTLGIPLLPAGAGLLVAGLLQHGLGISGKKHLIAGTSTSFFLNFATTPELHSPVGFAYSATTFFASLAGGFTAEIISTPIEKISQFGANLYQSTKKWCTNLGNLGFFSGQTVDNSSVQIEDVTNYQPVAP